MSIQHQGSREAGAHEPLVVLRHESMAGTVLRLVGDVDLTTAVALTAALAPTGHDRRRVVVDLARVCFVDSSGLAALALAKRSINAAGSELTLRAVPVPVYRLLQVTHFADVFGPVDVRMIGRSHWCSRHGLSGPSQV